MTRAFALVLTFSCFCLGQETPTFRAETNSAFVWGQDSPTGAVSSTVKDPLTGNPIHKLTYRGIDVSSRAGWERQNWGQTTVIPVTVSVVNNTDYPVTVQSGGASYGGYNAPLLYLASSKKSVPRESRKYVWETRKMRCFTSGYFPSETLFTGEGEALTVAPKRAVTMSFAAAVPREREFLGFDCVAPSGQCLPINEVRYYLRVNGKDYVFVWGGGSVPYCGK